MTKGYFADYVTIENNRETLENKREILNILLSDVVFLWGKHLQFKLDTSTIKRAISNGTLIENVDCKKFGRDWVILKSALERVYVEERKNLKK